jgi:hypothetical protein
MSFTHAHLSISSFTPEPVLPAGAQDNLKRLLASPAQSRKFMEGAEMLKNSNPRHP